MELSVSDEVMDEARDDGGKDGGTDSLGHIMNWPLEFRASLMIFQSSEFCVAE